MKSVCILLQNHYEVDIRVMRKAEALVAAGYSVDVLALRSSLAKAKTYSLNGVTVHTIGLGKNRGSLGRYCFEYLAFFFWAFFKLWRLMDRRAYSVVDVNNLPDFLVFAAVYAKWKGAKVVFDMHEITPEFYSSKYTIPEASWVVRLLKIIERASFEFADHVITINEPIKNLLVNRGLAPSKCTVIMNSVDEKLFASNSKPAATSLPAVDGGKFVMMYHGTLTRIYGLDIALEAFGRVHRAMPHAELWILGNGPEKSVLQALAQELGIAGKVKFIGSVPPQEVKAWLDRCSVGVLATRRDVFLDLSFSNKLSEYIIMGKAVIASRLKSIRYYFGEEALAFFEPNDAADLAKEMLRLCRDSVLRHRLAERAQQEYEPIRWELMKQRYLEMMAGLVWQTVPTGASVEFTRQASSKATVAAPTLGERGL
jgi:glycosyltransferase involved in cell wall biosynthesis